MSSSDALLEIANDLKTGFEALLERLEAQRRVEADLRKQLARAVDRYTSNHSDDPSDGAFSEWQDEIVKQISHGQPLKNHTDTSASLEIQKAREAIAKLKGGIMPPLAKECPVAHAPVMAVTENRSPRPSPRKCPVAHKKTDHTFEDMEKDFTTQGKPSSLECPFATSLKNGPLDGSEDPIAAEFHADSMSAQSLDAARACGKCPIRFLDKHSPEEIAQYFEKHKHELPRSHELCVKRYQANETSIRQLDAKYGNIVSMIQGLGNKHKPYLANDEQAPSIASDQRSTAAVEKWADNIDSHVEVAEVEHEAEQRVSRFEAPLRDVRVGESPSRPWGIHVPVNQPKAASAISSLDANYADGNAAEADQRTKPEVAEPSSAIKHEVHLEKSTVSSSRSNKRQPNQIIFNGPVFLGYSPEQAAQFINQLSHGNGRSP